MASVPLSAAQWEMDKGAASQLTWAAHHSSDVFLHSAELGLTISYQAKYHAVLNKASHC